MRTRGSFVVVGWVALLVASRAAADASPADIAAARDLAVEGIALADAGKCPEALEKLERAEKLHHAPTILGRMGECKVLLGRLVEGTEALERVVREPLGDKPPPAYVKAVARAQKVLAEHKPKIARLVIVVKAPAGVTPTVTVDGEPVPSALFGAGRPTDPGAHAIEASAPGLKTATAKVTLATSASETVELVLEPEASTPVVEPEPPPVAPPPTVPPPKPPSGPPDLPQGPRRWPMYVSFGVGGAALVTGGVLGVFALMEKSKLAGQCSEDKRCPAETRPVYDRALRLANASTLSFAIGAVGVSVGGLLWWLTPSSHASTRPYVGLGEVGVTGGF